MAIRKDINVVLSLDDAGFSSKVKEATEVVDSLKGGLTTLGSSVSKMDSTMSNMSKSMDSFMSGFSGLGKQLSSISSQLTMAVERITQMGDKSKSAASGINAFADASKRAASASNTKWLDKYASDLKSLGPALRQTVTEIIELDRANIASAASGKKALETTTATKLKALEIERENNLKIINERKALVEELSTLQQKLDQRGAMTGALGKKQYFGKNANSPKALAIQEEANQYKLAAAATREEVGAVQSVVSELEYKNREIAKSIEAINTEVNATKWLVQAGKEHAEQRKAMAAAAKEAAKEEQQAIKDIEQAQKNADRAAEKSARDAANLRREELRKTAQAEREHAAMIAQMWKGMAQTYSGAKIEQGLHASVDSGAEMSREKLMLSGMGNSKEEVEELTQKAWDDSKVLKFASAIDTVRARIAMMGGLPNATQDQISALLPRTTMVANNLGILSGDQSPEHFKEMVRNLTGVIEARGQTTNPAAAEKTLDLVQKIYEGTGGKIDIKDLETFLRRDATGANKIDDKGLSEIVAFMDAAKVSGGGNGGAGAGVSTVGTAFKMFMKYANGATMTEEGAKEFAGAGLIDYSKMDKNNPKLLQRQLRQGGLNVSELANARPVEALEKISNAALAYMSKPQNLAKYFGTASTDDPEARKNAMAKFAAQSGWTQTAQSLLISAGDSDIMNRAHAQEKKISSAKGGKDLNDEIQQSYIGAVKNFDSALTNLKITLGENLLPTLAKVANAVSNVIKDMAEFAKDHTVVTTILEIVAGLTGLALSFKGFMSVFGTASKITDILKSFKSPAAEAGVALEGMAISGTGAISMIGKLGGAFLKAIPIIGQLATFYMIADWIANFQIGGAKLIDYAFYYSGKFYNAFVDMWDNISRLWKSQSQQLADQEEKALRDADQRRKGISAGILDDGKPKPKTLEEAGQNVKASAMDVGDANRELEKAKNAALRDDEAIKRAENHLAAAKKQFELDTEALKIMNQANGVLVKTGGTKEQPKTKEDQKAGSGKDPQDEIESLLNRRDSGRMNPLDAAIAEKSAQLAELKVKLNSLLKGGEELDDIAKRAAIIVKGNYDAGKYDERIKGYTAEQNHNAVSKSKLDELTKITAAEIYAAEQTKGLTFAQERLQAATIEVDSALARFDNDGNLTKKSDQLRALEREFSRAAVSMGAGTLEYKKWTEAVRASIDMKATADAVNHAADYMKKKRPAAQDTTRDEAAMESVNDKYKPEEDQTEADLKAILSAKQRFADEISALEFAQKVKEEGLQGDALLTTIEFDEKELQNKKEKYAQEEAALKVTLDKQVQMTKDKALDMSKALETPIEKLANSWRDTNTQINNLQDQWANGFISLLEGTMTKGESRWKQFGEKVTGYVTSILKGVEDTVVKQALAKPIESVITSGSNWLKDALGGSSAPVVGSGIDGNTTALTGNTTQLAANTSTMGELIAAITGKPAAGAAGNGLGAAVGEAGGGMIGSLGEGSSWFGDMIMGGTFANGGIMTNDGPVSLRKYANGGIANSPQLALYGEAGPEAYVPLPDGRSIPVTLSGNMGSSNPGDSKGSPAVTVNVINQSGTNVNATQSQPSFDASGMILNVVLTAANQPGSFRTGMQAAMK